MKTKFLVSLIAVLAVMTFVQLTGVMATTLDASATSVKISNVDITSGATVLRTFAGDIVPVSLEITSNTDVKDATISLWLSGHKETQVTTKKFHFQNGTYPVLASLKLPSKIDQEDFELVVNIETEEGTNTQTFDFKIQREAYVSNILSIDNDKTVKAGENLAVDVVVKNLGSEELEDLFVVASIPELGIQKRIYFEDLVSQDSIACTTDDCNKQDSAEGVIYLRIPTTATAGVYDLKVEAYNSEASQTVTSKVVVAGAEANRVVVPVTSKEIASGSSVSYDVVLVNAGNNVVVYEIAPETVSGVVVSVDKTVVTIPAGSSEIVKVSVQGKKEGTYSFAVNVNSDGKLVNRVVLNANVVSGSIFAGNVAILTIVLAIVFLVLLVVLIVLLTRKPAKSEELEESYY